MAAARGGRFVSFLKEKCDFCDICWLCGPLWCVHEGLNFPGVVQRHFLLR